MFSRWGEGPDWPLWNDKTVSLFFKVNVECRKSESIDWSLAKPSKPNFCCDLTYLANPQQTVLDILDNTDGRETLWVLVALRPYNVGIVDTLWVLWVLVGAGIQLMMNDNLRSFQTIHIATLSSTRPFLSFDIFWNDLVLIYMEVASKNLWIHVWGINSEEGLCNKLQKYPFRPPESKSCLFHVGILSKSTDHPKFDFKI